MKKCIIMLVLLIYGLITNAQDNTTFPMGGLPIEVPVNLSIQELELSAASSDCLLPVYIDNSISTNPYFPTVFNQLGESCSQASTISYCFTYEMNRLLKDTVGYWGNHDENLFYYLYTYNFLNDGSDTNGTSYSSGYNIVYENGIPRYNDYYHDSLDGPGRFKYWMSGYDKYLQGKVNTISELSKVTFTTESDCLINLKHWLSDHNEGNGSMGGVATIAPYFHDWDYEVIPNTENEVILTQLSLSTTGEGHALTVVGYNDTIGFDFNNDNMITNDVDVNGDSIINLLDYEIGALCIVNSWGNWGNQGKAWFPYHFLPTSRMHEDFALIGHVEEAELPDYELKVEFAHESRGCINLAIGCASDANVDAIHVVHDYELMKAYNRQGGDSIPMQGVFDDPIELALNFGKVFKDVDFGKVFFKINEVDHHDYFEGEVNTLSLIDYRWDETFEIFCEQKDVPIVNWGNTILSINYDLLPHHAEKIDSDLLLYSDMVSRFKPTVTNNSTLTVSDITIDMYESTITIEEGSSLVIKDNSVFDAKKGNCEIIINGNVQIGDNVRFIAQSEASLDIHVTDPDVILKINNCVFENCQLNSNAESDSITNSNFLNSNIICHNIKKENYESAIISNNNFSDGNKIAIDLSHFNTYSIEHNTIDNMKTGIMLNLCGDDKPLTQNIYNNDITNCSVSTLPTPSFILSAELLALPHEENQ